MNTHTHSTRNSMNNSSDLPQFCISCNIQFPLSFGNQEKNIHVNRCLDGKSAQDMVFWKKCVGNLQFYREFSSLQEFKKSKETTDESANENQQLSSIQNKGSKKISKKVVAPKIKKLKKKKNADNFSVSDGVFEDSEIFSPDIKSQRINLKSKNRLSIVAGTSKSMKHPNSSKGIQIQKKKQPKKQEVLPEQPKKMVKVIVLPIVTELIYNPSIEFDDPDVNNNVTPADERFQKQTIQKKLK